MRGAVAAGHPLTARAGAEVLAEGGNAVDACIAAAFASWVTESPLTGLGGGGFQLVHRVRDRTTRLLDFYVAYPGEEALSGPGEMESIEVDFSGGSTQVFHVGGASCGVPGNALGLETAHRAYGSRPWRRLVEHVSSLGGTITEADLTGYRAIWRRPVQAELDGYSFLSNPPPATGGVM